MKNQEYGTVPFRENSKKENFIPQRRNMNDDFDDD